MDKQLGCGYFCCHSCGFKFEAWGSFHIGMHGRLELVITHIGRFSLSLFSKEEPAAMGHAWKA